MECSPGPSSKLWFVSTCGFAVLFFFILPTSAQSIFHGPMDYPVGSNPDSVVVADFNGDGRPDIATANLYSNTISVLLQNSGGTFQTAVNYAVGNQPVSLQVGDITGDGGVDLVVFNSLDSTISVLLGNGDGTFQPQKVTAINESSCCLAVGDFNGDGKLDVAVPVPLPQVGTYGVAVLLGNGDGTFQAPVSYALPAQAVEVVAADFNNDGKLDLAISTAGSTGSGSVSILLGNGDGTFQAAINTSLISSPELVVADFNQDGNLDIATSNGTNNVVLLFGNGDGTFAVQQPLSFAATPLAAGDLNGDGKPDLIANDLYVGTESLLNNGDGTFTVGQIVGGSGPVALSDVNADQKLDLVLAVTPSSALSFETQGVVSVVDGNGDGTFATFPSYPIAGAGTLVTADFNGDGQIDLAEGFNAVPQGDVPNPFVGLLLNSGAGFSPETTIPLQVLSPGAVVSVGAGDFNNDGNVDLAIGDDGIAVLLGNGNGTFQSEVDYGMGMTGPIAVADFNNDQELDVLGLNSAGDLAVILGNGNGTFGLPLNSSVNGIVYAFTVADFNHDGKPDVAALVRSNTATYTQVLLGNGDGTFSLGVTYTPQFAPNAITSGDLNGDGIPDLVVGVSSGNDNGFFADSVVVLLGKGDGTFQSPITTFAGNSISSIAVADFNLDGKQDVALSNAGWNDISLLLGNGNGTFQAPVQYRAGGGQMVAADFDGNGSPDLAVIGPSGVSLLLSAGHNGSAALVSPTAMVFGNQNVGQAGAGQTAVLSNTNSAALSIASITVSGAQASDYQQTNTCGASLGPGTSCTISVTFTPQAAGVRTAAIQITDSAFNSPQIVNLSGSGIAASDFTFGVPSGGSSSATITAGQTATFGLTLTPSGSFSGTVNLTCSVTPAATAAPICSVPASVSISGGSSTPVTVTVSTTASSGVAGGTSVTPPWSTSVIRWTMVLATFALLFTGRRRRALISSLVLLLLLAVTGCGGTSSSSTSGTQGTGTGTPAGTYTATVAATSGGLTHQVALTVTVQ